MTEDRYDWRAIQERWLPVWDELAPFRAGQRGPTTRPRKYVLDMFPYPSGDLHMGHAEAYAHRRRGGPLLGPARLQRAAPDRLGLLRPARGERRDQARRRPARRGPTRTSRRRRRRCAATRCSFDWDRVLHTSRPGVLPLEPVAVPAAASSAAWPTARTRRSTGARRTRPCWPTSRSSTARCERCGTAGHQEEADPVVLPDHRLRRPAARRHGAAGGPAGPTGCCHAAQLDRPLRRAPRSQFAIEGRDEPVTVYTTRPDTLFGATFFVVAADSDLAAELAAGHAGRGGVRRLPASRSSRLDRDRPAGHRPGEDRRLPGPVRDQPGERRAAADLRRRLRAGRLRHRRDHGRARARPARPGLRPGLRPAGAGRRRHRRAGPGRDRRRHRRRRRAGQLRPAGRAAQGRRRSPRIIDELEERGHGRGRRQLPAARLADLAAALLGHADPDHPLPGVRRGRRCPTTSCRCVLPDLRGAGPDARRAPRRWRRRPTGSTSTARSCGGPAQRDTDTMDTFVDSSWYFLRYLLPGPRRRPVRRRRGATGGCRSTSTSAASTHAILHLLYARFFTKVLHDMGMVDVAEPFTRAAEPGQVINGRLGDEQVAGNLVSTWATSWTTHGVDAVRLTMVFAGPPEDDIDWADVSPAGSGEVPGPGLAAGRRRRRQRAGRRPGRPATSALRAVDPPHRRTTRGRLVETLPVQRRGRHG